MQIHECPALFAIDNSSHTVDLAKPALRERRVCELIDKGEALQLQLGYRPGAPASFDDIPTSFSFLRCIHTAPRQALFDELARTDRSLPVDLSDLYTRTRLYRARALSLYYIRVFCFARILFQFIANPTTLLTACSSTSNRI